MIVPRMIAMAKPRGDDPAYTVVAEPMFVTRHGYNHLFRRKILNSPMQANNITNNVTG